MTRLLPRLPRRATAETDPAAGPATAPAAEQPTAVGADGVPLAADAPATGAVAAAGPTATSAPAGTEPSAPSAPGFRRRAGLRRRLRFLRRVRELGFRDLGGLVFDQHRFGRRDPDLVTQKVTALAAVDGELRAIEAALHAEEPVTELREAGVSACARCGALIGSDARFCSSCGASVRGAREVAPAGDPAQGTWSTADLGGTAASGTPAGGTAAGSTPAGGAATQAFPPTERRAVPGDADAGRGPAAGPASRPQDPGVRP